MTDKTLNEAVEEKLSLIAPTRKQSKPAESRPILATSRRS